MLKHRESDGLLPESALSTGAERGLTVQGMGHSTDTDAVTYQPRQETNSFILDRAQTYRTGDIAMTVSFWNGPGGSHRI